MIPHGSYDINKYWSWDFYCCLACSLQKMSQTVLKFILKFILSILLHLSNNCTIHLVTIICFLWHSYIIRCMHVILREFLVMYAKVTGTHPAFCTMGAGSYPGVKSGRGVTLTPHPLLVPWSWKSRAIPLHPLWAVRPVQSFSACTRVHFTFLPLW